jgi:hypothetical protein
MSKEKSIYIKFNGDPMPYLDMNEYKESQTNRPDILSDEENDQECDSYESYVSSDDDLY